jgi:fumarylpyruvate hydrolase
MLLSASRRNISPVLRVVQATHRQRLSVPTAASRNFTMAFASTFAFDPPDISSVEIQDSSERFPIHRIYCVGRNYSEHVREMGGDPNTSVPSFFTKPADAIVPSGSSIPYAMATNNLHYEVELVVCIGKAGVEIPIDQALPHIFGYAVGLDLTRRDMQNEAKSKGLPWDSSKAFDQSAPIGAIRKVVVDNNNNPKNNNKLLHEEMMAANKIQLSVNGQIKQDATLNQMVWSIPEIIHQLSHQFYLQPGDLIFTGTPAGVGPIVPGDFIQGTVEGLPQVTMKSVEKDDDVPSK